MASRLAVLLAICAIAHPADRPGATDWERGVQLYQTEEYREAQDLFEQAVNQDPENSKYQLWLGLAMGRRAERMTGFRRIGAMSLAKQVKQQFEAAVELDGSNLDALEALQGFHFQAPGIIGGSKAEAGNIAGRIEEIDKARGAAAWAAFYEQAGDFEKAGQNHSQARELAPNDTGYLLGHAGFLARRKSHADSDALFGSAFDRDPDNPDVWLEAAKALVGANRRSEYPRAKQLLERYLASTDRKPNSDPPSAVRKLLSRL